MRGLRQWISQTVIVSTASFDVRGKLSEVRGGCLVLKDTVALQDGVNTPVDGLLVIPEVQVRYVQVP